MDCLCVCVCARACVRTFSVLFLNIYTDGVVFLCEVDTEDSCWLLRSSSAHGKEGPRRVELQIPIANYVKKFASLVSISLADVIRAVVLCYVRGQRSYRMIIYM